MSYKDHTGKEFETEEDMCKHWGVTLYDYTENRRRGYNKESCLTGKGLPNKGYYKRKKCKDYLGREYNSVKEMCDTYGITSSCFNQRLRLGYTLEQSLTGNGVKSIYCQSKSCRDHLGKEYSSIKEMCSKYGITYDCFNQRMARGYSLKQSLTGEGIRDNDYT